MPTVNSLTGFREDSLEMGFEQATRLSFTLVGVRADDAPLDLSLTWTYVAATTPSPTVLLTGKLRVLEERLSPTEDSQRYELTDLFEDLNMEAFVRTNDSGTGQTNRFVFNKDTNPGVEDNLKTAVEAIESGSAITGGVTWVTTAPSTVVVDKNIKLEARGIGEFITQMLRFAPSWRWYYDSALNKIKMVNLDAAVTAKEVYLNKLGTNWYLRTPKFSNLVSFNVRIDENDCYSKVRLEGLGKFQYRTDVQLEPGWFSTCLGTEELVNCLDVVEPYMSEDIKDCSSFACRYIFPEEYVPAAYQFIKEEDTYRASPQNELLVEASVPQRNLGRCKNAKDYPGGIMPDNAATVCDPQETPWEWTDFVRQEIARIPPPVDKNKCGEYVVSFCPRKLFSALPFWSPEGQQHVDEYPTSPMIEVWDVFVSFWEDLGTLVAEKTGGCPNGRVYHRYNADWMQLTDENGTIVMDDQTVMDDLADRLLEQIGKPKVSGEIVIHLHPRSTSTGLESYAQADSVPFVDFAGISLGDAVNIIYDTTESFGTDPYPDAKGILPDAGTGGADVDWEHMGLRVTGLSFSRIDQSLKLTVANSPFIFGDKGLSNFQR